MAPKRKASTKECGQGNGQSSNSSVRIPLSNLNGFEPDRLEMALDVIYWQEDEGSRMDLNGNILLPSFFCQSSGVSGQRAGRPEGGASHPRCIHVGPRVRGAAGTPRKRLEGAFGARFRLRSLAGHRGERGTRFVSQLHPDLSLTPFSSFTRFRACTCGVS